MCARQIVDMDVVANAGSIRRRVIPAEHLQFGSQARRRAEGKWNQMRLRIVQFADFSAVVCAGGIEVAQTCETEPVGAVIRFQRLFKKKLRDAVGIDWLTRRTL